MGYLEAPPAADLRNHVTATWTRSSPASRADDEVRDEVRVIPDACVDIVWIGRRLVVAGPDTGAVLSAWRPGWTVVGVRFHPGLAPSILGVPASELLDRRVELGAIWGDGSVRPIMDELSDATTGRQASAVLEAQVRDRLDLGRPRDPIVESLVRRMKAQRFDPLATAIRDGIGLRQLRRRTIAAVGYGPRMLARVLRLQRAVALARGNSARGLADLAAEAGYADQSHMTREIGELTSVTPAVLFRTAARESGTVLR